MDNELSLETRASSAYVQGRLAELYVEHADCPESTDCSLHDELGEILDEWKQAEAELTEVFAKLAAQARKEIK